MEMTEELLVASLSRIAVLEGTLSSLCVLQLRSSAIERGVSFQQAAGQFGENRALIIHQRLNSLCVQFPQFEKLIRGHVDIGELDAKEFWKKFGAGE
jgi:hypothetical protein